MTYRPKSAKWDRVNRDHADANDYAWSQTSAMFKQCELPIWEQRVLACLASATQPGWRAHYERLLGILRSGRGLLPGAQRLVLRRLKSIEIARSKGEVPWEGEDFVEQGPGRSRAKTIAKRPAWMSDPSLLPKKPPPRKVDPDE